MKTIVQHTNQVPPFLKWAGNKQKINLTPYLTSEYNSYYEPFLGSGAVYFKYISPRQAYLSDVNANLIQTFIVVRDHLDKLLLRLQSYQDQHCATSYYTVRDQTPSDPIEIAARFIYLNRTCFNGLYRENSKGKFNVPMGDYVNPGICTPEKLTACSLALQDTIIECKSYQDAVKSAEPGDLVYFDPPYYQTFTQYHEKDFKPDDQIALRDLALTLVENQVQVLISNSDHEFIRDLYSSPQFVIHSLSVNRSISAKKESRGVKSELLIQSTL